MFIFYRFKLPVLLSLLVVFFQIPMAHALSAVEFESRYNAITQKHEELLAKRKRREKSSHYRRQSHFIKNGKIHSDEFRKIKIEKRYLDHIHGLKQALKKTYRDSNPLPYDKSRLDHETTQLAIELVDEIGHLKGKYKSFALPIVHNMLIDIGVKKRGACKHWAEDLLEFLRPIKREFFHVTWGEANPKKITEHNVAVLYPKHASFYDGVIVDPWRTSGKPFWVQVKKDKHYKWNPWDYYGVY